MFNRCGPYALKNLNRVEKLFFFCKAKLFILLIEKKLRHFVATLSIITVIILTTVIHKLIQTNDLLFLGPNHILCQFQRGGTPFCYRAHDNVITVFLDSSEMFLLLREIWTY